MFNFSDALGSIKLKIFKFKILSIPLLNGIRVRYGNSDPYLGNSFLL